MYSLLSSTPYPLFNKKSEKMEYKIALRTLQQTQEGLIKLTKYAEPNDISAIIQIISLINKIKKTK